ncbi:Amidohydrolase [Candidatus Hydrogenisulfobacillus filiaventi]|uniref:Amidohydrolase n=1 Tax=Candidatus Hydrogenisulfobacillus filiaventi TaxID=2707344 RepID=A0A6F8ZHY6_9FIRM|nr:amidohydrolase family protein [Bacillota bacterium]CAB1129289.1 Amidohydrolase [Candidatus Hydrogenisulfobacillus filiaventi]
MWALVNVQLRDGTGLALERGGILVDDQGRIAAVEPGLVPPAGAAVVDGGGLLCLPGFIDAHSHIGLTTAGETLGWQDVNEETDPVTADIRALDGINPADPDLAVALAHGVTAAFVTPGSANVIGGLGATVRLWGAGVEEMLLVPAAGMKAALGENPVRVHGREHHRRPATRPGTAAVLREWLERARRYAADPPRGAREWDPRLEALGMVIRREVPLRVHCHRADDIRTAHRLAREFRLRWVIDHGTEAHRLVEEIRTWEVPVVTGPSFATRSKAELRDMGFHTPARLAAAGVPVAIASDHPVVPSAYLGVYAGLAVAEGMPYGAALAALTTVAAEVTGVGDRLGRLERGYDADLVLWEGDPLASLQARVKAVWLAGRLVHEG